MNGEYERQLNRMVNTVVHALQNLADFAIFAGVFGFALAGAGSLLFGDAAVVPSVTAALAALLVVSVVIVAHACREVAEAASRVTQIRKEWQAQASEDE